MPASTPFYGLSYFLFGDDLEDATSVEAERSRFLFIDKQIYGLYNIFGDGTISGWQLRQNSQQNNFTVVIEPGYGFVDGQFAQTTEIATLENLMPNTTYYVIARKDQNTDETNRDVIFVANTFLIPFTVFLGTVTVGNEGVTSIDISDRTIINFLQIIKEEINNHRHRGEPTKIDLQTEVKNQLSGARIKDLDTSKVVSGRFDIDRIPQINHEDLNGIGLLTHAALDSFAKIVTNGNQQLLGEVAAVNTMKLITAQLYFAKNMQLDVSNYVEYPNLQMCIPGVTSDSVIDFFASSANINTAANCISGKEFTLGGIQSIFFDSDRAFFSSTERQFVSIARNTVELVRGGETARSIEGFRNTNPDGVPANFTVDISILRRTVEVVNGQFTTVVVFRTSFIKGVDTQNDWTNYDELTIEVKSTQLTHGAVYMYLINGTGAEETRSSDFLLLNVNEVTDGPNSNVFGFVKRVFNISNFIRNNIRKMVIYTDDTSTDQVFFVDNISIRAATLYPPQGFIKFRHSSAAPVTFNNINYDVVLPDGCDLRVRARVANSPSLLLRAEYTLALNSGDVFQLTGTDIEIEIVLVASIDRKSTPIFKGMELQYIIDSVDSGFTIRGASAWNRGVYLGTTAEADSLIQNAINLKLADPLSVNEYYYLHQNGVGQNLLDGTATVGFRGLTIRNLISPKQSIDILYNRYVPGFNKPRSVRRLVNKNYLIADTANDRILEVTSDGNFVHGVGSHVVRDLNGFYPMNAIFNPKTGVLAICFSQDIVLADLQINKIKLWVQNTLIFLTEFDIVLENNKSDALLEIQLTNDKVEQLSVPNIEVFVDFDAGVFANATGTRPFRYPVSSRKLVTSKGLRIFVGDFVYSAYIQNPIHAIFNRRNNLLICNSKIMFETADIIGPQTAVVKVNTTVTKRAQAEVPDDPNVTFVEWDEPVIPESLANTVTTSVNGTNPYILEITISNPSEDLVRPIPYNIILKAVYSNGTRQVTFQLIIVNPPRTDEPDATEIPSVVELKYDDGSLLYENNMLYFSEFSLGSVYEVDDISIMITGLYDINDDEIVESNDPFETFEQQAIRKLANSAGKTIVVNKSTDGIISENFSPDNLYPSDAVIDQRGQIVIAESSFVGNAGRIIKIDDSGNITWQVGFGLFGQIHDIRAKINNDIIVSL